MTCLSKSQDDVCLSKSQDDDNAECNECSSEKKGCLFVCPRPIRAAVCSVARAACVAQLVQRRHRIFEPPQRYLFAIYTYISPVAALTQPKPTRPVQKSSYACIRPHAAAHGHRTRQNGQQSILSAHKTQRERFAYTMHDSRGGCSQGAELWKRCWRLEALGTLRASVAIRAGATERRAAPTLGRRVRRPGVQRTKWDKLIEATYYSILCVLHTVTRHCG